MIKKQPLVTADNITIGYSTENLILEGISFEIHRGDFVGVTGANGGGKTTLMKSILGILPTQAGQIHYFDSNGNRVERIEVGYVPQQNSVDRAFPISVTEVVGYGLLGKGHLHLSKRDKQRVQEVLETVGMASSRKEPIGTLSGGQLQRILLARAIVASPELLVLDEPNTYVDKQFEGQLYRLLPELNRETTIVIVSHDIADIAHLLNRRFDVNRNLVVESLG